VRRLLHVEEGCRLGGRYRSRGSDSPHVPWLEGPAQQCRLGGAMERAAGDAEAAMSARQFPKVRTRSCTRAHERKHTHTHAPTRHGLTCRSPHRWAPPGRAHPQAPGLMRSWLPLGRRPRTCRLQGA